MKIKWN